MWNSPKKLLFFDEKDFDTGKDSGPSETVFHGAVVQGLKVTSKDELNYSGIASTNSEASILHDIVTPAVSLPTTSVYEMVPTFSDSRRPNVDGHNHGFLLNAPHRYSFQHATSSHSCTVAEHASYMAFTRSSVTMVTTGSACRRPTSAIPLQQITQAELSADHTVSISQPELDISELSRLQFEALAIRPTPTVSQATGGRPIIEETAAGESSVQRLCSLMELQAHASLRQGMQEVGFTHELHKCSQRYELPQPGRRYTQQTSLLHPLGQSSRRQRVQDGIRSCTLSPPLPFPSYTREVTEQCNFCKRNGERRSFYSSHKLQERGRVTCPILQRYVCPLCGATGESAHTISYCPLGNGSSSVAATRTQRKSCGCRRACKHGEENRH